MLVVKINNPKDNRDNSFKKMISNFIQVFHEKIVGETKVLTDKKSVEILAGDLKSKKDDSITAELTIKKVIHINNDDFDDKQKLDQFIKTINNFCEHAKQIEEFSYTPPD